MRCLLFQDAEGDTSQAYGATEERNESGVEMSTATAASIITQQHEAQIQSLQAALDAV